MFHRRVEFDGCGGHWWWVGRSRTAAAPASRVLGRHCHPTCLGRQSVEESLRDFGGGSVWCSAKGAQYFMSV